MIKKVIFDGEEGPVKTNNNRAENQYVKHRACCGAPCKKNHFFTAQEFVQGLASNRRRKKVYEYFKSILP